MTIDKVLNNNAVVCINENSEEVIVTGKGIAFQKKRGDLIDDKANIKIFTLSNQEITKKFQELVVKIPVDVMEISEKIIQMAKSNCSKKINDTIYITLTDHIYSVCERYKNGITLKNELYWDIKRLYKEEFKISQKAIEIINDAFSIDLLEDEAAFMALHFVNAELDNSLNDVVGITKIIREVLNIVKYHYKITFDENSISYDRFITHLKFFGLRLLNNNHYISDDDGLYEIVRKKYPEVDKCVSKIKKYIFEKYNHYLSSEEQLYLIINIERVIRDSR